MGRSICRCALRLTLILAVLCLPSAGRARGLGPIEIGLFTGGIVSDEELIGTKGDLAPTVGARIGGHFSERWAWSFDAQYAGLGTETFAGDATMLAGRGAIELRLMEGEKIQPFYSVGWGYTNITFDNATDFTSAFASLGLGQHVRLGGAKRLRWEARIDRTMAPDGLRGEDLTQLQLLVGLNWGVGKQGPSHRDSDGDGVRDRRDRCGATPPGAAVDREGCSSDRDVDGVEDSRDRCTDTPRGWAVDADGCPQDQDGDGIPDGKDVCPGTPGGAAVSASGCPGDEDGDGIYDGIDRCAGTLKGIKVDATGCFLDADDDGVYDGLGMDQCPGTPPGVKVDAHGCP